MGRTVLCALLAAAGLAACSSPETLQGDGAQCFETTECQAGFACVPQADGTRRCSSDLTPIQKLPPMAGGKDAAPPREAGEAGEGGAPQDATTPQPDVGSPPPDTGSPPPDVGSPPPDAGSPPPDTGSPPPPDAGSPPPDAGSAPDSGAGGDATAD